MPGAKTRASQKRASGELRLSLGPLFWATEARFYEETVMSGIIKYDFEGQLYSFNLDGWFNATEAAKRYGRRLDHWLGTAETLEYIRALDEVLTGKRSQISNTRENGYLRTRRGQNGGTWMHPKL